MKPEKLFISPLSFHLEDTLAIQTAVDTAQKEDIQVVSIPQKPDGTPWHLTSPVLLPSYMTVILDGCVVEAESVAFMNLHAQDITKQNLAGEQHKIFLLGRHGGTLRGLSDAPHILLKNCRDCRIAELSFQGGAGIDLCYFRYSKLQQLRFAHSRHAVILREGCNNVILESVSADTEDSVIVTRGSAHTVMGRDSGIYNSILCRISAKTQGAPAVLLTAGDAALYNIVLRDVTDETEVAGAAVVIGKPEDSGTIRDLTVRGVKTARDAVRTCAVCDGMFYSNLQCEGRPLVTEQENTREHLDEETMQIVLPQYPEEKPDRPFLTPNTEEIMGRTDSESIQNAVDTASARGINLVVIPRWNVRTQQAKWELEKAIKVPSSMTVVFLQTYLRQADFCYENMFTNSRAYEHEGRCIAREEHDLTFCGIGDVVLDGGMPNGLLEKTCNLYGLPDKRYNAAFLFNNVRNLVLENLQIRQSRWYGCYFIHCDTCRISNIDFDDWEDCTNRDGVDIRSGCHNFLVENITGTTADDTVALNNLGNDGNDGRYVEGKDPNTLHMVIRNIKSDAGSWFTIRLLCQDRHLEQDFTLDTIMDVSYPENQKSVDAVVMVGSHEYHYKIPAELGDLAHLTVRDVYSRSRQAVAFGGCSDDVAVSNIHVYGDGCSAVSVRQEANVRNVRVNGVFHKRQHMRLRGTAAAAGYESVVISLPKLRTDSMTIENVYADTARMGVFLNGDAKVEIKNFHLAHGEYKALCGRNCELSMDGETIAPTPSLPL